jgi:hypothetical protein
VYESALDLTNSVRFDHDWAAGNLLIAAVMDDALHPAEDDPKATFVQFKFGIIINTEPIMIHLFGSGLWRNP